MQMLNAKLVPLTAEAAETISRWKYDPPYEAYSFRGHQDDWLWDESTWGREQFCLVEDGVLWGQAAGQLEGDVLWVGWSMAPQLCGRGNGAAFAACCVRELRRVFSHSGRVLLRVSARNERAIRAYRKAGFQYVETIQDEIACSGHLEDFWVMESTVV